MNTAPRTNENDLLVQFVEFGNTAPGRDAFDGLIRLYVDYVFGIARRATRDDVLAEDVTQVVFFILARKARSIRRSTQLPAWLFRTTRYAAANALKLAARRAYHERRAARPEESPMPTDDDALSEIHPDLENALASLSQKERHIILLRYYRGLEYAGISAALGISEDTARKRLSRGIEHMRKYLSSRATPPVHANTIIAGLSAASRVQASPAFIASLHSSALSGTVAPTIISLAKGTLMAMAWSKVKMSLAAIVCLLLIGGFGMAVVRWSTNVTPSEAVTPSETEVQAVSRADTGSLTINVDSPGSKISPVLYGLTLEEVNHSLDGGLYGELIQNRAFQELNDSPEPMAPRSTGEASAEPPASPATSAAPPAMHASLPAHWTFINALDPNRSIEIDPDQAPTPALSRSLRFSISAPQADRPVGIANEGYWGIPVKPDSQYRVSFFAKAGADFSGSVTVDLESMDGKTVHASATINNLDKTWKKYTATLKTGTIAPSLDNRFVLATTGKGTFWVTLISVFPPTYNDRPNGNRIDLMQLLADLHPQFMRFPAGNYLEGNAMVDRFNWKQTIGPLEQRPGHRGPWGYFSTDGMGLLEFLECCEDLKAEPILNVYAGISLDEPFDAKELKSFVQDALDEIEYACGDKSTAWGARRAADGHPDPFKLTFIRVGSSDGLPDARESYDQRFTEFYDAIKAKYPNLQVITSCDGFVHSRTPDFTSRDAKVTPRALLGTAGTLENWNRGGPRIALGVFQAQGGNPTPNLNSALADAALLTAIERNSDFVTMSSYVSPLANVIDPRRTLATNLIGYDALTSFGSTSYYAQRIFGQNRGDTTLPVEVIPQPAAQQEESTPQGAIGVGTWTTTAQFKEIKVSKPDGTVLFQSDFSKGRQGWDAANGNWNVRDGALTQTSVATNCFITTGDPQWTDYTLSLKARKTGGGQGFLILFHVRDNSNLLWWNIGGWKNTRSAVEAFHDGEKSAVDAPSDSKVETDHWYDVRVEVRGRDIECFLDNQLINHVTEPDSGPLPPRPLFASASRVDASGEVILKVVNITSAAESLEINIKGVTAVDKTASVEVLAGDAYGVNTLAQPQKIVPQKETISIDGPRFVHKFPPHSVTVLRMKTR